MSTLLVKNAEVLVTFDEQRREIRQGFLWVRDGWIEAVGEVSELDDMMLEPDETLDLTDHILLPGLINTHHHLYQTLTRAIPSAQNEGLFPWLQTLYPLWANLTPDHIAVSTQLGLAELALSGCTTTSDHLYLFPPRCRLDDQIEPGMEVGLRFHAARGSMSLGESKGGLPPDSVVEDETFIIEDTQRIIETYHQAERGAMLQIVVAPCSPFSVSTDAMVESAKLGRTFGVKLHTHLAENQDEERFCIGRFGKTPIEYAESTGWLGKDVWYAHAVHIDEQGIRKMGATGTGIAHCPTSNMRLASGIAPLYQYLSAGVPVGLGVDGSASNDSSHLLGEARQSLLVSRLLQSLSSKEESYSWASIRTGENTVKEKGDAEFSRESRIAPGTLMTARQALEVATLGGAQVLGRDDIGSLQVGKAADFIAIDLNRIGFSGSGHDPVAALLFCQPTNVDYNYVHGRPVVKSGALQTLDLPTLIHSHRQAAHRLVQTS